MFTVSVKIKWVARKCINPDSGMIEDGGDEDGGIAGANCNYDEEESQ